MPDRLEDYDFTLPPRLIAQHPLPARDRSRLMVLRRGEDAAPGHHRFSDLPRLLPAGALLVRNNTRVAPLRLAATLAGGVRLEALLVEEEAPGRWRALVKKARRLRPGMEVPFGGGALPATALERTPAGGWRLAFAEPERFRERLERYGLAPLPPYIRREVHESYDPRPDREAYQTCYASVEGAVAAPTAGLHFTPAVLAALEAGGVEQAELTLHVGPGTFAKVTSEDPALHSMAAEWCEIPAGTVERIRAARGEGRPVIAVGTTTVRALESWAAQGTPPAYRGWSGLFIRPPHAFRAVDGLLTNFHLPRSTLLMLVSAFHGRERLLAAYREAIARDYRFFSFGDCMAILPGGVAPER
jgi:S-adenosylmethionine:tRNA ribosyltransferase-isomerase